MAALFQCFRRNREDSDSDCEKDDLKLKGRQCKCNKIVKKLLECPKCKSSLHGYWESGEELKINKDGAVCGKITCEDRDSQTSKERKSESSSDGNSPTSMLPPITVMNGNTNNGFADYRPMATGDISGMSYMPVSKNAADYNMNHRRRGKALIFNFDRWNNTNIQSLELSPRDGSEKDKKDLTKCLNKLAFEVETYDNLKRQDYDSVIDRVRQENHSDADCLLIAIMTHGEKNSIYLSDGSLIPVNNVWEEFEANVCPTLAGKPKIFLIQACRGDRYDHGTQLMRGGGSGNNSFHNDVIDSGTFSYVIPNAADIIVAFSCPLGHYSWRHPEKGSWFIQSICNVFDQYAYQPMEIQSLLTTVAREVAVNYVSSTNQVESDRKKQVPSTSSTLIRNVIFRPKQLVRYQPHTPIANRVIMESATQTPPQSNGHSRQILLEDVQVAVAVAQSAVEENNEIQALVRRPDTLPGMMLIDSKADQLNIDDDVTKSFTDEQDISTSTSSDLTPEDPSVSPSQDQPILPTHK